MALRTMSLPVVGLSHQGRDETLRRFGVQGGAARVEREPGNQADHNAIAVRISVGTDAAGGENWLLIGYVAADRAAIVAPLFDRQYFRNPVFVVRVDMQAEPLLPKVALELTYEVDDGRPNKEMRAARSGRLVAELSHLRWDNIEGVPMGDKASLWLHPEGLRVHVYRRGSIGGLGFLGSTTHRRLIRHMSGGRPYEATFHAAGDRAWIAVRVDSASD